MNKIKSINIITLVLQFFATMLLFFNGVYFENYYVGKTQYLDSQYRAPFIYPLFSCPESGGNLLGVTFLTLLVIMAIILIVQLKNKKCFKITPFIGLVQLILFIVYSIMVFNTINYTATRRYEYTPGDFFYIIVIVLFVIIILSFANNIISKKVKANTTEVATVSKNSEISNADELKQYKDLFDSGVITQEEFDAKKKQLLGL